MLHLQIVMLALALATTMLIVDACGGSSKTTSTPSSTAATTNQPTTTGQATTAALGREEIKIKPGKPLSRAAWISKGDAICAGTTLKLKSMASVTPQETARLLPQAAAYEHREAVELSKLVPPKSKAQDWNQIVTGYQKYSEYSIKAGEYSQVKNLLAAASIVKAANLSQRQIAAVAKKDGFTACAVIR